jgi:hypothetical protein
MYLLQFLISHINRTNRKRQSNQTKFCILRQHRRPISSFLEAHWTLKLNKREKPTRTNWHRLSKVQSNVNKWTSRRRKKLKCNCLLTFSSLRSKCKCIMKLTSLTTRICRPVRWQQTRVTKSFSVLFLMKFQFKANTVKPFLHMQSSTKSNLVKSKNSCSLKQELSA